MTLSLSEGSIDPSTEKHLSGMGVATWMGGVGGGGGGGEGGGGGGGGGGL